MTIQITDNGAMRTLRTPLLQPYERLAGSGGTVRLDFSKSAQRPTRLAMPADYATDKLKWFNAKNGSTYGNPAIAAEYGLATVLVNSGTTAYLHKFASYPAPLSLINPAITWNKVNKKITITDIVLDNDLEETSPTVIYDDDETLWSAVGAGTTVAEELVIKAKGTSSLKIDVDLGVALSGGLYTMAGDADYHLNEFFCLILYGANSGDTIRVSIVNNAADTGRSYDIVENFTGQKRFVIPLAVMTNIGAGTLTAIRKVNVLYVAPSADRILYVDRVLVDVGPWVKVEAYIPDTLAAADSTHLYSWTGAAYEEFAKWDAEDDSTAETVTAAKLEYLDGTASSAIFAASTDDIALFRKGVRNEVATVVHSIQALTYSAYYGCLKRIGFSLKLPPDDGLDSSTTGISQARLKLEVYYADSGDPAGVYGQTSYEFEDSANAYYGLDNLNSNWMALFDATNKVVRYFIIDKAPTALKVCADENECIHWIEYGLPAGARVYGGETYRADVATDTDGDGVPDFLEEP